MNEEEELAEIMKQMLEVEFNSLLEKGEDIRSFLYYPHHLLTDRITKHLDIFLINEAWKAISSSTFDVNIFTVYQDELITVTLYEKKQQEELLDRLINYFTNSEEYEKCSLLVKIAKQLL